MHGCARAPQLMGGVRPIDTMSEHEFSSRPPIPSGAVFLSALFGIQLILTGARLLLILGMTHTTGAARAQDFMVTVPLFPDALVSLIALFVASNGATKRAKGRQYPGWFFPLAITTILLPGVVLVMGMLALGN